MRSISTAWALTFLLIFSCKTKITPFSDQLKANFLSHLIKADSSLILDSFRVLRVDTANQRLFDVIDDTLYKKSLAGVQIQMENATKNHITDSMAFYQTELDYMIPTRDSLNKVIAGSDTIKKYGLLATCKVQVRRRNEITTDNIYYFLNLDMTILNMERIDSSISQLSLKLKGIQPPKD